MPKPVYFKALRTADAKTVARLERKLFAKPLRDGPALLAETLGEADQQFSNLSVGLFAGRRLVGYLIAYIELGSVFGGNPNEEVVYLRGLAIEPGHRRHMVGFMQKLAAFMTAYCPGAPVEAEAVAEKANDWAGLRRLIQHYGYTLCRQGPTQEQAPGVMLHGLRWEMQPDFHWLPDQPLALPRKAWDTDVAGAPLQVRVVTTPRQWLALRDTWDELLRATPGHTVFQSFAYLWGWWRHFGTLSELRILVISQGDSIIGIAPMAMDVTRSMGLLIRDLGFIGAPWQVDRAQFLFGNQPEVCLEAVMNWLAANQNTWDICSFYEQDPAAKATAHLSAGFHRLGCFAATSDPHPCPYLNLNGDFSDYLGSRSRKHRQNLRRARKQLETHGEVTVEVLDQWPSLERGIERYAELEERSWKSASQLGIGRDKADYGFYRWLAETYGQGERGNFQLRFLKVGTTDVAATFGVVFDRVFYSLMITHDQAFNRQSPGTLLEAAELEDCFSQDLTEYDMLGGYVNNKLRWTSTVRSTVHQHFVARRPRPALVYVARFVIMPWAKRWLQRKGLWEAAVGWKLRVSGYRPKRSASQPTAVPRSVVAAEDPTTA